VAILYTILTLTQTLTRGLILDNAGKTTVSDHHQIRVRVRVSSSVKVAVRFGSLSMF